MSQIDPLLSGLQPVILNGFPCFDQALALKNNGFSPELFDQLFALEKSNFWFNARNRLLIHLLQQHVGPFDHFLEIGCGTGFVLSALENAFPDVTFYGSEIYLNGLQYAKTRVKRAHLFQMNALEIPFKAHFDLIGAFDVLEHIDDHERAIDSIKTALKPEGHVLLSVPQHPWLWSQVDDLSHHKRRYGRHELQGLLIQHGFKIVHTSSFVCLLLPLMLAARLTKKNSPPTDLFSEFKISAPLNTLLSYIMSLELVGHKLGIRYPVGGSRIVLAQKQRDCI